MIELDEENMTRCEHFGIDLPKFSENLQTWGESGAATMKTNVRTKMTVCGTQCTFVNCSIGRSADDFKMHDPNAKQVINSRDVSWLKRMQSNKKAGLITCVIEVLDQDGPEAGIQCGHQKETEDEGKAPAPDSDEEEEKW